MADVFITISLKPGTTQLHLEDSQGHSGDAPGFYTDVNGGDTVYWQLADNSGIEDITGIRAKSGAFTIFNNGSPGKNGHGWKGKVKDDASGNNSYDIDFSINGKEYSEDPDIKVEPRS
jgi:hypothetical protein